MLRIRSEPVSATGKSLVGRAASVWRKQRAMLVRSGAIATRQQRPFVKMNHEGVQGPYNADDGDVSRACSETIAKAMDREPLLAMACKSQASAVCQECWRGLISNILQCSGGQPIIYTIGDEGPELHACMIAAFYPQHKGLSAQVPGLIDTTHLIREDALAHFNSIPEVLERNAKAFEEANPSFLYVKFLSTHPEHQGKGLGSRLLRHVLAEADHMGIPAYLEATNDANMALYQRYGFQVLHVKEFEYNWTPIVATLRFMARPAHSVTSQHLQPLSNRHLAG